MVANIQIGEHNHLAVRQLIQVASKITNNSNKENNNYIEEQIIVVIIKLARA